MAKTSVSHSSGTSKWSTVPGVRCRLREEDFIDLFRKGGVVAGYGTSASVCRSETATCFLPECKGNSRVVTDMRFDNNGPGRSLAVCQGALRIY